MNPKPTIRATLAFNDPEKADGAPQASYGRVAHAEGKRYGVLEVVIYALFIMCAVCPMLWVVQKWAALPPQLTASMEERENIQEGPWHSGRGATSDET